jgi:putative tryptophan/tyrosine transport system substrate-binding protein
MAIHIRRREFIATLGSAALWPLTARAQQGSGTHRIGVLMPVAEADGEGQAQVKVFKEALQKLGRIEGRNLQIEYRWTGGNLSQLPIAAKELADLRPEVILARTTPVVAALVRETRTLPIVFVSVSDPVGDHLVESFARPGGNVTGFTNIEASMSSKWVELLKEIFPQTERAAMIFNPKVAPGQGVYFLQPFESAAATLGLKSFVVPTKDKDEIEPAIASIAHEPNSGLVVNSDVFTSINHKLIVQAVEKHRLPAVYPFSWFPKSGGLISYGTDITDLFRRAAEYVDRILKGQKPADLPVQAPTKFELVINLKTAKAFGVTIPQNLLVAADEVIE